MPKTPQLIVAVVVLLVLGWGCTTQGTDGPDSLESTRGATYSAQEADRDVVASDSDSDLSDAAEHAVGEYNDGVHPAVLTWLLEEYGEGRVTVQKHSELARITWRDTNLGYQRVIAALSRGESRDLVFVLVSDRVSEVEKWEEFLDTVIHDEGMPPDYRLGLRPIQGALEGI